MSRWSLRDVDPQGNEWVRFLSSMPHLVFHEPEWARVATDGLGAEPLALLLHNGAEPVAGVCGCTIRVLGIRSLYLGIPYGGVLSRVSHDADFSRLLAELARDKGIARIVLTPFPGVSSGLEKGFSVTPMKTHVLQIKGRQAADIRATYKSQVRRNLRKAERTGVEVEIGHDPEDLEIFYSLYLASMRRNHALPKYGRSFVQAVGRHLLAQGTGALLLARVSGRPVAGILVVDSDDGSHYLMGGSDSAALGHRPNELLFDTAIQRSVERGQSFFDFLPSGAHHPSLEEFKKKFGCEAMPANSYERVTRSLPNGLWRGIRMLTETTVVRRFLYRVRSSRS